MGDPVLDDRTIDRAALMTHDIANAVGYAFAAQCLECVLRLALIARQRRA